MTPTRPRLLVLIGVLAAAVTWALLIAVYASLPPLTWTLVPALLIAAGAEAWTGRDLRARIQGRIPARPVPALFVARMVALAKASSQTAALLAGVSAGFMIYLSGMLGAPTPRSDLVDASLSFAASLVLLMAALFLEWCCRVPRDPRQDRDDPPPPRPSPFDHLSVPSLGSSVPRFPGSPVPRFPGSPVPRFPGSPARRRRSGLCPPAPPLAPTRFVDCAAAS